MKSIIDFNILNVIIWHNNNKLDAH